MHTDVGPAEIGALLAGVLYGGARLMRRLRNGRQTHIADDLEEVKIRLRTLEAKVDLVLSSMQLRFKE